MTSFLDKVIGYANGQFPNMKNSLDAARIEIADLRLEAAKVSIIQQVLLDLESGLITEFDSVQRIALVVFSKEEIDDHIVSRIDEEIERHNSWLADQPWTF